MFPKNRGKTPKMDGENNGKPNPYFLMDDLGVFPYFWKHPHIHPTSMESTETPETQDGSTWSQADTTGVDGFGPQGLHGIIIKRYQEYFMTFDFRVYCSTTSLNKKSCFVSCLLEIVGLKARYTGR